MRLKLGKDLSQAYVDELIYEIDDVFENRGFPRCVDILRDITIECQDNVAVDLERRGALARLRLGESVSGRLTASLVCLETTLFDSVSSEAAEMELMLPMIDYQAQLELDIRSE